MVGASIATCFPAVMALKMARAEEEAEAVKANAEKAEAEDVKENAEKEKRQKPRLQKMLIML